MNIRILLTFAVLTLVTAASAQSQTYDDYDLKNYYTPDMVRSQLDLSLNSSGNYERTGYEDASYKSRKFNGNFSGWFNHYKNTRKFFSSHDLSLNLSGLYSKSVVDTKNNSFDGGLRYETVNRFYKSNNSFYEIGGAANAYISNKKQDDGHEEDKLYTKGVAISVPLAIGKGRIENVVEARQAIYILENLTKRGALKRKLSEEEIFSLAQVMTQVKNKRFLDARIRQIEEISTVDSFFVANDLLNDSGAAYYTTLYDYWNYGDLFDCGSGTVYSVGITPSYNYHRSERKPDDVIKYPTWSLKGYMQYEYERPSNLYWQHAVLASPYIEYIKASDSSRGSSNIMPGVDARYRLGYYPTSRTNVNLSIQENLFMENHKYNWQDSRQYVLASATELHIDIYYYFSQNFRLSFDAGLSYLHKKPEDSPSFSQFYTNYSLRLTYSIF